MPKDFMTDDLVDIEIRQLNSSEYVKLYRKAKQIRERRKQYLYSLRWMEKQGKALAEEGYTLENMEQMLMEAEREAAEGEGEQDATKRD